jgi:hypothetical protein
MALFQESGQTPERRREEAEKLLGQIIDHVEAMTEREQGFVRGMAERFEKYGDQTLVSVPQLFWLREIRDRYA